MQAVAAGSIVATHQDEGSSLTNEEIAQSVMLGLRMGGHTDLSTEELDLISDACCIIAGARDSYAQALESNLFKSISKESSPKETESIQIIFKKNEYPS